MGCGASKDGEAAVQAPTAAPVGSPSAAVKSKESEPTPAQPKEKTPAPPATSPPPAKTSGARFNDAGNGTAGVEANAVSDGPQLKKIVSFNSDEKPDGEKPRKVPDTPFVKKTADFEEMFDEEEEEDSSDDEGVGKKKKKGKKKGEHVNFGNDVEEGAEKKKNMAPGTPFVRLGAAFDDLYDDEDDEESEEEEEEPSPAPKKKGKSAPVKFDEGCHTAEEDKQKEKLTPGTPFVKMGGGFDDLYDEDEDESDLDSDEEEAPAPKPDKPKKKAGFAGGDDEDEKPKAKKKAGFAGTDDNEPPREQKNPPKKKAAGSAGNVGFSGDTKEEEKDNSDFKQPGTPFVKLGGFNDLYDEDDDEDDSEEDDEDDTPVRPKKEGGGIKFADGTEDHNREDAEHVPGTPFVKLGAFNDLYDEDEDEEEDESEEEEDEAPAKPAETKPAPVAAPPAAAVDPATLDMELPSIGKVKI